VPARARAAGRITHTNRGRVAAPGDHFPAPVYQSISSSEKENFVRILLINNDGGGFADHIDVADETTVETLFKQRVPGRKAEDFLIRVNRQPASADQILHDGDRVSFTPTKIEGARAVA
jgi:hypothetical protein